MSKVIRIFACKTSDLLKIQQWDAMKEENCTLERKIPILWAFIPGTKNVQNCSLVQNLQVLSLSEWSRVLQAPLIAHGKFEIFDFFGDFLGVSDSNFLGFAKFRLEISEN